jgi:hypothetical protein
MKKIIFFSIILIYSVNAFGFKIESNNSGYKNQDTLNIITANYSNSLPDSSAYVNIDYPQISNFKDEQVEKKVNNFLRDEFLQSKTTYEEMIADSSNFNREDYDYTYSFDTGFEMPYNSDKFLSIKLDHYEFTGGAHGNFYSIGYNIDLSDGKLITLADIIQKDSFDLLSWECEQAILDTFQVNSLSEAGLFEDEINIMPDQDFYIIPGALVLQFDPYEIGPFSMGEINVTIPFYKIKDILKSDLPFPTN